jgi:hypothetical protein
MRELREDARAQEWMGCIAQFEGTVGNITPLSVQLDLYGVPR